MSDEPNNVISILNMATPAELQETAKTFEEKMEDESFKDAVRALQKALVETEEVVGVVAMVMCKDMEKGLTIYTPGVYDDATRLALTLGQISMCERMIQDEAQNYQIQSLAEGMDQDD